MYQGAKYQGAKAQVTVAGGSKATSRSRPSDFNRMGAGTPQRKPCQQPQFVEAPLRRSRYSRVMVVVEWSLLMLDVIGAGALGAGLIILIRRRRARYRIQ